MIKNNFNRILKVLNHEKLDEPVLFEYGFHGKLNEKLAGYTLGKNPTEIERLTQTTKAYMAAGYDYVLYNPDSFSFPHKAIPKEKSISLNNGIEITDMESFKKINWPNPAKSDYSILKNAGSFLPDKMKIILRAPGGLLAHILQYFGFENLCFLSYDNQDLIKIVCDTIGERLYEYYRICISFDSVGAAIYNDDWGFISGTFFSEDFFKKFIFPWVKKITSLVHQNGKPVIIHTCGRVDMLMDHIIDNLEFDAKHSFEDKIMPIEEAYQNYGERIALLGGIDVDFLCRSSKEKIYDRCKNMVNLGRRAYALGSGNSIPPFIPDESFFAMISAANL